MTPHSDGRLHARPALYGPDAESARQEHPEDSESTEHPARPPALPAGLHKLAFPGGRQVRLYVPANAGADRPPCRLLVLLHGVRRLFGEADQHALAYAQRHGLLLLIPDSLADSWDVIRGGYGPDIELLDRALTWTMRRYRVDPDGVAIGGFSDGASYALAVGLMNGDLFSDIVAFAPGFMRPLCHVGAPRVFIAHGSADAVLPIANARAIALDLAERAYRVRYEEFAGGHEVPAAVAERLFEQAAKH